MKVKATYVNRHSIIVRRFHIQAPPGGLNLTENTERAEKEASAILKRMRKDENLDVVLNALMIEREDSDLDYIPEKHFVGYSIPREYYPIRRRRPDR